MFASWTDSLQRRSADANWQSTFVSWYTLRALGWPTLAAALLFVAFWETRSLVKVQLVEVSAPALMQLADVGVVNEVPIEGTELYARRHAHSVDGIDEHIRAAAGLPSDGELLVTRFDTMADKRSVPEALTAGSVTVR